jgi:hypothetical protein
MKSFRLLALSLKLIFGPHEAENHQILQGFLIMERHFRSLLGFQPLVFLHQEL